jgi:calnexin
MFALLIFGLESALPLKPSKAPFHFESFSDAEWNTRWQPSALDNYTGSWDQREALSPSSYPGERLVFATTESAYHGLGVRFPEPLDFKTHPLIVQYEVRFLKEIVCGGAYIKLFGDPAFDPVALSNETLYTIMFGPDKCGDDKKVHFIFRHAPPTTGVLEEKHLSPPPEPKMDRINHLYTLIIRPDHTFTVMVDAEVAKNGSLFKDFKPPVNPPETIDDPTDRKPSDWVDEEMMDDPDAKKPEDWDDDAPEYIPDPERTEPPPDWLADEPRYIPDPEAVRPDDWDEDIHGEWEAPSIANPKCETGNCGEWEPPLIENPNYQGKWVPPTVKNPNYKGEWVPRQIPNPDYYEDPNPYAKFPSLTGAGFELWVVTNDIGFSNVYIGTDEEALLKWNEAHFLAKHGQQEAAAKREEDKNKDTQGSSDSGAHSVPGPKPTLRASGEGPIGALTDFVLNLKDQWQRMYNDSPEATMIVTVVVGVLPIFVFVFGPCCREQPVVQRPLTPAEKAARQERRRARRKAREEAKAKAEAEAAAAQAETGQDAAPDTDKTGESQDTQ